MDALAKTKAAPGLELVQVPKPVPREDEVLIKIRKTAICGTDLHIYNWDGWSQKHVEPQRVIGHEYVGEIAEMGSAVKSFHIGQRVSGEGHIVCGHCRNCRAGNGQWCHETKGVGVNRDGAFAEYLCIPASNCIPINPDLDEEIVSFFDALGNATHTALMFDLVGEDILITGAGPIGIMAAAICRHTGARNVIITDINDYRLNLARKLGATAAVNVTRDDLAQAMKDGRMVEGFDVGMEMSGAPSALDQMITSMRNGGKVALLGLFGKTAQLDMDKIILKGLGMQGIYGRRMYETWYKMSAMVESGLDLRGLITHRFHYSEFQQAFDIMGTGNSGKIILDWGKKA
ncbi:MAG: L-threonine 3-dehydrogenase [Clostridiales bacterium]|nr:L-threonine 3-dehydrogenase [Clostridiales bacterium]